MAKKEEVKTKIDILIDTLFQVQSSLARMNQLLERQLANSGYSANQDRYRYLGQAEQLGAAAQQVPQQVVEWVAVDDPLVRRRR